MEQYHQRWHAFQIDQRNTICIAYDCKSIIEGYFESATVGYKLVNLKMLLVSAIVSIGTFARFLVGAPVTEKQTEGSYTMTNTFDF